VLERLGLLSPSRGSGAYHAFISYSHAVDRELAPALQRGLQRFAKPWYRARALRVFRDETGLSANPHLWSSIAAALDASQRFVLLASPEAAQSPWVAREVEHWCTGKSPESILIAVTDGDVHWDSAARDFDWQRTTALPTALRGKFAEEPRWIDLRWARTADDLSLSHPAFRDAVAELGAPLHGKPKEELASEEVRQHRRTMRIARSAAVLLALLTAASISAGVLAIAARNDARRQRDIAVSARNETQRQLDVAESRAIAGQAVADFGSQLDRGLLLALEAYSISPTAQARASLVQGLEAASHVVRFVRLPHSSQQGQSSAESLAFSPDGATLAVGNTGGKAGTLLQFAVATGKRVGVPLADQEAAGLAYSPDGSVLAVGGCSRSGFTSVVLLRLSTGRPVGPTLHGRIGCGNGLALQFGPGGQTLMASDTTANVATWEVATGREIGFVRGRFFDAVAEGAAISPDGREIAVGGQALNAFDSASGSPAGQSLQSFAHGGPGITSAAFAPSGNVIAAGTFVGTVVRWNPSTARTVGPTLGGLVDPTAVIESVAFSPNGKLLAAGDSSGVVTIFALAGSELAHATAPSRTIPAARSCYSPTKGHVSVVGCAKCADPTGCVYAYAPDRQTVAIGDVAGDVDIWDVRTRRPIARLRVARTPSGYRSVGAVAFSPDGKTLAAMSSFGASESVTLWDVSSGAELGTPLMAPAGSSPFGVVFSRDGQSVAAYSTPNDQVTPGWPGGTVTWQALPLGGSVSAVRSRICDLVGRNLTHVEWRQFVPGRAYRKICPQWP
jgi:WD40 repeat protein